MAGNGKVDWYGKDVMLLVQGASDELLAELAFNTEGVAKTGAPVDTGFMRNAMYSITPQGNGRAAAAATAGAVAERDMAPTPGVAAHEAAMHAAAEYTIYQENKHGFIYHALEDSAAQAGGKIQLVGKKWLG